MYQRMPCIIRIGIIIFILGTISISHAEIMRVAVMDLNPQGVDENTSRGVSDLIRGELIGRENLIIVERGQMNRILEEQGFQQSGCSDTECAVQIGKLLSAQYMILGSVTKFGTTFTISVRMVDVEKGTGIASESTDAHGESELPGTTRYLVNNLVEKINTARSQSTQTPSRKIKTDSSQKTRKNTSLHQFRNNARPLLRTCAYIGYAGALGMGVMGIMANTELKTYKNESEDLYQKYNKEPSSQNWESYESHYTTMKDTQKKRNSYYAMSVGFCAVSTVLFLIPGPAATAGTFIREHIVLVPTADTTSIYINYRF